MPDLIAQGSHPSHRWRRTLPVGRKLVLGRAAGIWATPWDDRISRRHMEICWQAGRLEVTRLESARNPVFIEGTPAEYFTIKPGQHFVVGNTTFTLTDERVNVSLDAPLPTAEQTFSAEYLRNMRFRDADKRIDVLGQLPDLIAGAASDDELCLRVINAVLTGVSRATAAAVVIGSENAAGEAQVKHWDRRIVSGEDFRPSDRLIRQALERQETVLHVWGGAAGGSGYTLSDEADWAYCVPVAGIACRNWAIYVTGNFRPTSADTETSPSSQHDLRDDVKFSELVAATLGSLREVRQLERRNAGLSQFFSPVVLEALAGQDPQQVLAPRETEVAVLFCDLRGFSRRSERAADDLLGLLHRVSGALGIMTRHILAQGGVVGDFHGDSAMGFWGWPLAHDDAVERACRAALGIRAEFGSSSDCGPDDPLSDFRIGLGIATGKAVAGKIGTTDQVKVTVFGPVVNLASRLEGMTKLLRAPILIDQATARIVRQKLSPSEARVRRLAVVRPYGMDTPLEVSELLPPAREFPQLEDRHIEAYEAALDALLARNWPKAFSLLHQVPADDEAKDFLTVFIAQHSRQAPAGWDGVIPLQAK